MFTYKEHTADIAIEAIGKDQESALRYVTEGLIGLMQKGKKAELSILVEGKGDDDIEKVVNILNTIISLVDSEGIKPVRVKSVMGWNVEVEFENGACRNVVKAATFHRGFAGFVDNVYKIMVIVDI